MPTDTAVLKLGLPVLGIVLMLAVARFRGVSWRDDLGLAAPLLPRAIGWLLLWAGLVAAEEWVGSLVGVPGPQRWQGYSAGDVALRVAAIGLAGPMAEELAFRGLLLHVLRQRLHLRVATAIIVTAVGWSAIHGQYGPAQLAIILLDGLVLGVARVHSRSIWTPIAMHALGNLFSISQSLAG